MKKEILTRQTKLLYLSKSESKRVIKDLKQLEKQLKIRLLDFEKLPNVGHSASRKRAIQKKLDYTADLIKGVYEEISTDHRSLINDIIIDETEFINETLVGGFTDTQFQMTPSRLRNITDRNLLEGLPSADWWEKQGDDMTRAFTEVVKEGLIYGDTRQEMRRRLLGSKAMNWADGMTAKNMRNADALIRTSVMNVSSETRNEFYLANEDLIGGYEHLSTLDSRTTKICVSRDGLRWNGKRKPIGHTKSFRNCPVHWNCRSVIIPFNKDTDAMEEGRTSIKGLQKHGTTFKSFLDSLTNDEQVKLLGKGRLKMFKAGKISLQDLTDDDTRVRTIADLRKK